MKHNGFTYEIEKAFGGGYTVYLGEHEVAWCDNRRGAKETAIEIIDELLSKKGRNNGNN